jgi:Phospholipase_D-nuclease N-terminal
MVVRAEARHYCPMVRVFLFLAAVELALVVLALISCLSAERSRIRAMPRALWVVVILVLPIAGPVLWFLAGRPGGMEPAGARRPRPRPSSPDDDPEFLRKLDANRSSRDRELFERWEQDLRRRDEDQRRRDEDQRKNDERPENDEARHRETPD